MRAAGAEYSPEVDVFAGFRPLEGHLQASWDHMAMARYLQAQAICMVTKVPRNHAVQVHW